MADIAGSLVSNSTQLDNVDLMGGARVFTIIDATYTEGAEQPLSIRLQEYPRPWKPGLTMRRLLAHIWESTETDDYIGRRVRLYRDEAVSFGKVSTGGTRVSHASHIDKKTTVTLPISKGKFAEFTVEPLKEAAPSPQLTPESIATSTDVAALKAAWEGASAEIQARIVSRVTELEGNR